MNIKETLKELVSYYQMTRQAGHTTAMLAGGVAHPDCIIITHNDSFGVDLQKMAEQPLNTISLGSVEHSLRGHNKPLLFDNAALLVLFVEALRKIEELENTKSWEQVDEICVNVKLSEAKTEIEKLKSKLQIIKSVSNL